MELSERGHGDPCREAEPDERARPQLRIQRPHDQAAEPESKEEDGRDVESSEGRDVAAEGFEDRMIDEAELGARSLVEERPRDPVQVKTFVREVEAPIRRRGDQRHDAAGDERAQSRAPGELSQRAEPHALTRDDPVRVSRGGPVHLWCPVLLRDGVVPSRRGPIQGRPLCQFLDVGNFCRSFSSRRSFSCSMSRVCETATNG